MNSLDRIEENIEAVVARIREDYPDWLCRRGCDACCRHLAETPRMTLSEWLRLREGLLKLPTVDLALMTQAILRLSQQTGPILCPMLDEDQGACRVYLYRPVACRSYGYYAQRGIGLHCRKIEAQVDEGLLADVVWGNQDALECDLRKVGGQRSLNEWLQDPAHGLL